MLPTEQQGQGTDSPLATKVPSMEEKHTSDHNKDVQKNLCTSDSQLHTLVQGKFNMN